MIEPLIITIIPTYRRPHLLRKAIQSVLSQTYHNFQVWICDNASGDATGQIVAGFANRDQRVKYFCHEKNIGMMGNYQFGLSLVNTDFFSFLSDDDVLLPHFYETALQEFKKYPNAGFVAGSTIIMTEKGQIVRIPLADWTREGKFDPPGGVIEMIGKYPVPTSVLFSKIVIERTTIDLNNPAFWDCDYLLQIAAIFPIVISKKPCALFRQHEFSYSNQQTLAYYEDAFQKLIKNIQKNKNLTAEKSLLAINLILSDLALCHKHFLLYFLMQKKFDESYKIAKVLKETRFFKNKAIFYLYIIKICKIIPFAYQGLIALRKIIRLMRKIKKRPNKEYASTL